MFDFVIPDKEQQQLQEKLEKLSEVLRKRTREFHETGQFSHLHGQFLSEIEKKNAALRSKIGEAVQSKKSWQFVKAELLRDYEAAINEFMTLGHGAEADAIKKTKASSK
jgi:hypothetical protein